LHPDPLAPVSAVSRAGGVSWHTGRLHPLASRWAPGEADGTRWVPVRSRPLYPAHAPASLARWVAGGRGWWRTSRCATCMTRCSDAWS